MTKYKPQQRLEDVIGFTDDDLEDNLRGDLSNRQISELLISRNTAAVIAVITLLGSCGLFALVFTVNDAALIVVVQIIAGITALWGLSRAYRFQHDLRDGLEFIDGPVHLDIKNAGRGGADYLVAIEDVRFRVKKDVFLAFKNGDPYRIFFAPHSKRILSVEWLRE
jgi:hypothetical protein